MAKKDNDKEIKKQPKIAAKKKASTKKKEEVQGGTLIKDELPAKDSTQGIEDDFQEDIMQDKLPAKDSTQGIEDDFQDDIMQYKKTREQEEVNNGEEKAFSTVSVPSTQKKVLFILLILLLGGVFYYFLFKESDAPNKKQEKINKALDDEEKNEILDDARPIPKTTDAKQNNINGINERVITAPTVESPKPPPPPPMPTPVLPPPPKELSEESDTSHFAHSFFDNQNEIEKRERAIKAKMKSGIMVTGGGGGQKDKEKSEESKKSSSDFLGFGDGSLDTEVLGQSSFPKVKATAVNHLNRTILQGKIIFVILETAINTDIPGLLRAIVTRDVYAEKGTDIMIPKGSRVIGQYAAGVKGGQTRIAVMWSRLIRPDGIDIAIASGGVDSLGRSGVAGDVYTHFWNKIASAFLVSFIVPVASAEAAAKATGSDGTTTTSTTENNDGTTTTTGTSTPVRKAINDSTERFSELTKDMFKENSPTIPTITVNQGTKIDILVQRDLIFPPQYIIQKRSVYK
jgi:type IV secretion system protein VirB10